MYRCVTSVKSCPMVAIFPRLKTHRLFLVDNLISTGVNNVVRPTTNKLSTMLFQVVTVEQCCTNMLTILFIVGRTTLFTPVDINLEQVVDFLNFYACSKCRSGDYSSFGNTSLL